MRAPWTATLFMSVERFTLDTNVLIYALDRKSGGKHETAAAIVDRAADCDCVLTVQALSEFFVAATRKGILPRPHAATQVRDWLELFPTRAASGRAVAEALAASERGRWSYWDALLLATAGEAGCSLVISEDMHDGARLGDVSVLDPFAAKSSAALSRLGLA